MMTIPECRHELRIIMHRLKLIEKNMHRRKPARRARKEHVTLTPTLKRKIRKFAGDNPRMSYVRIGKYFNVGIGRVSEALRGKR